MPVSLTDVVRAAVSEVEDYARVEVRQLPEASVQGAAVADVTHLLAEIIENAAQFSPPHTRVRVTGEPVGNGYALEVEDRGLGMGRDALAEANHRIARSETLAAAGGGARRPPPPGTAGEPRPPTARRQPPEPSRPDPAHDDEQRTPEAVRDRMTAYRDGWSRGGGRRPGHSAPPKPQSGDSTEGDPA